MAWSGLSFSRWIVRPVRVLFDGSEAGVEEIGGPSGRADAMVGNDNDV